MSPDVLKGQSKRSSNQSTELLCLGFSVPNAESRDASCRGELSSTEMRVHASVSFGKLLHNSCRLHRVRRFVWVHSVIVPEK